MDWVLIPVVGISRVRGIPLAMDIVVLWLGLMMFEGTGKKEEKVEYFVIHNWRKGIQAVSTKNFDMRGLVEAD